MNKEMMFEEFHFHKLCEIKGRFFLPGAGLRGGERQPVHGQGTPRPQRGLCLLRIPGLIKKRSRFPLRCAMKIDF